MKSPTIVHRQTPKRSGWIFALCLVAASLLIYVPALNGGPLWDDDAWTSGIRHLLESFEGLGQMWLEPGALQQYYPVTGTSFWIDHHLWGDWTLPYHVENVLLHALAAALFWRLLLRLQVPGAWLASAIFLVHPVMSGSVAWITERKNVLSQVLFLAALLAYGWFSSWWRDHPVEQKRRYLWYALALVLFAAALLAKITTFVLPPTLVLICWWRRGQVPWRTQLLPLLPFFAMAIALGPLVMSIEREEVGAQGWEWDYPAVHRWLIAGRAFWFYPLKLLWPQDICFVYPRWQIDASSVVQWLYPVTALLAVAGLWFARKRLGRGPLVAVLFYLGTLSPLLGFLNVYGMRYSYVWNHWAYLPTLSLIALFAAAVFHLKRRYRRPLALAMLLTLMALTWRQAGSYVDAETLWRTTLRYNPGCWMALNNLGVLLDHNGRVEESKQCFQKAIAAEPQNYAAYANLGKLHVKQGDAAAGIEHLSNAVALKPDDVDLHVGLGLLLMSRGQLNAASGHFVHALAIMPEHAPAHDYLGLVMLQTGRAGDAIPHFNAALRLRPDNPLTMLNLANALTAADQLDKALVQCDRVLKLKPDFSEAYSGKGAALLKKGMNEAAAECFRKAIALQPANSKLTAFLQKALDNIPLTTPMKKAEPPAPR